MSKQTEMLEHTPIKPQQMTFKEQPDAEAGFDPEESAMSSVSQLKPVPNFIQRNKMLAA